MRQRRLHLLKQGLQRRWSSYHKKHLGQLYWETLCGLVLAPRYDMIHIQKRWKFGTKGIQDKIVWEINHSMGSSCPWRIQTDETLRAALRRTSEGYREKGKTIPDICPPRSKDYEVFYRSGCWEYPILVQSRPLRINPHPCSKCEDSKAAGRKYQWPEQDLDHDVVPGFADDHVCSEECGVASYDELLKNR